VPEIYDRIGFAAVGKYNEFENLRVAGIRANGPVFRPVAKAAHSPAGYRAVPSTTSSRPPYRCGCYGADDDGR
jgi:hypothetical protein